MYNMRVTPLFLYVASLQPAPHSMAHVEHHWANKVMRLPGTVFSATTISRLHEVGLVRMHSLGAACLAQLVTSAHKLRHSWDPLVSDLRHRCSEAVSMSRFASGLIWVLVECTADVPRFGGCLRGKLAYFPCQSPARLPLLHF